MDKKHNLRCEICIRSITQTQKDYKIQKKLNSLNLQNVQITSHCYVCDQTLCSSCQEKHSRGKCYICGQPNCCWVEGVGQVVCYECL
jgi:hypothetical protein